MVRATALYLSPRMPPWAFEVSWLQIVGGQPHLVSVSEQFASLSTLGAKALNGIKPDNNFWIRRVIDFQLCIHPVRATITLQEQSGLSSCLIRYSPSVPEAINAGVDVASIQAPPGRLKSGASSCSGPTASPVSWRYRWKRFEGCKFMRQMHAFGVEWRLGSVPNRRAHSKRGRGLSQSVPRNNIGAFTMAEHGPAEVSIVNLLGEHVARLFNGELEAGEHSFEWNATDAAAGTYFVRIRMGSALR